MLPLQSATNRFTSWWRGHQSPPASSPAPDSAPANAVAAATTGSSKSAAGSTGASSAAPATTQAPAGPLPREQRPWTDEVIYSIMTDRFVNGDKTNDQGCDPKDPEKFHGGDWQGIINKLDDLKNLGATTIWMSPVYENDRGVHNKYGVDGYHGYWPHNFEKTEPAFGTKEKLKELVDEAHKRGMKVLIDVVLNHTGYNHPWAHDPKFHDWFHHGGTDEETGELFLLPDLAQEKPEVAKYLIDTHLQWAREIGADGYRVDAIPHMPAAFQRQFQEAMKKEMGENFFMLGEAYRGDVGTIASLQKKTGYDGAFDFPLANTLRSTVGRNERQWFLPRWWDAKELVKKFPGEAWRIMHLGKGGARQFHDLFAQDNLHSNPLHLATLVENHDMPRFMSMAGPKAKEKFKLALMMQFCFRGMPTIYYGAEDGMGKSRDDIRADKRDGADPGMFAFIRGLCNMRHESIALRRGDQEEILADKQVYAFSRNHPQETAVVAANVSGKRQERTLDLQREIAQAATTQSAPGGWHLTDSLTGKVTPIRQGQVTVTVDPMSANLYRLERDA